MKKTMITLAAGFAISGAAFAQTGGTIEGWTNSAADGYPPCSSTVTDSCVQLYESGIDGNAALAMGGPYEPITEHSESMMSDGLVAMGGPIEERTDYPACDPGPGDDRCIQLYEPGVTGAGN